MKFLKGKLKIWLSWPCHWGISGTLKLCSTVCSLEGLEGLAL